MSVENIDRRRVLLAAGAESENELLPLFAQESLSAWEPLQAESFSGARFVLQHVACDVLVVHERIYRREGPQGLAWLAFRRETPVLFLGSEPEQFAHAYELGATLCLPTAMGVAHSSLLNSALTQTLELGEQRERCLRTREQLMHTRRHVDRLVNLIWRMTPQEPDHPWLPQRHLLERLEEELARCARHKLPLSVAVGELDTSEERTGERCVADPLPRWSTERIIQAKRRCDVVGQYGPRGFMLLMVQTPKSGGVTCCQRLQDAIQHAATELVGPHRPVRAFFGLASAAKDATTPQGLLRIAEQHLETARQQGPAIVAE